MNGIKKQTLLTNLHNNFVSKSFAATTRRSAGSGEDISIKLKIAETNGMRNGIGIDLVAMCVNEIISAGATPAFFLNYFVAAAGKLDTEITTQLKAELMEGCRQAGYTLIDGATREMLMPVLYEQDNVYDITGFAVGTVETRNELGSTSKINDGDVVIGLPSSGLHSNGFTTIMKIVEKHNLKYSDPCPFTDDNNNEVADTLGETLLTPTNIYVRSLLPCLQSGLVKAYTPIAEGGLTGSIATVLPEKLGVEINAQKWNILPVFGWAAAAGGLSEQEMLKTFNCGLGAVIVVSPQDEARVLSMISDDDAFVIGRVCKIVGDNPQVHVKNFGEVIAPEMKKYSRVYPIKTIKKKRVGVLITESITNLQSLIDYTLDPDKESLAEIVVVISNKAGVDGIKIAESAGIPNMVIRHRAFPSREAFDEALLSALEPFNIDILCLAGFLRILTTKFVHRYYGRCINLHPALLPSFKGRYAYKRALEAGCRYVGCTVHFVEVEVDAGPIIVQEVVHVKIGDTLDEVRDRAQAAEYKAYQDAFELVVSDKVRHESEGKIVWNV